MLYEGGVGHSWFGLQKNTSKYRAFIGRMSVAKRVAKHVQIQKT